MVPYDSIWQCGPVWTFIAELSLRKYEIQGPNKTYKYGVIYGVFWGGNTGNYLENYIKYGEGGQSCYSAKMKCRDKKKFKIRNHIRGILGGKYGEMPCNLHQIRGGRANKRTKVVQLMNVNRISYRFGLEKKVPVIRSQYGAFSSNPCITGKIL